MEYPLRRCGKKAYVCSGDFWQGYREVIPEAPLFAKRPELGLSRGREGKEERGGRKLYEAYHIINHYNLFGGGYLYQGVGLLEGLTR
ncbi:Protein-ribulosamine 3-kinase, chloroplastic [Symbiodinium microadriaticum]|uniref:Protein-ribulosamine 3-kinase, chloroplastic n=1 Tax=Symbiodinium microadriaticum TaxID=2951 RepID=A0A1Q9CFF4_SYMMI|nr:Protein-ribulosamine 3-kinase, chloroplastic [Symbiodinium microadriaticum]